MDEIEIRDGWDSMDFGRVTELLSKAFWCEGIGEAEVRRGAANSALLVGAFAQGRQIGYARVISDKVRFAYVLDVYVDEAWRGRGAARAMMRRILDHPSLSEVYQWLLITRDAHGLYGKLGFSPTKRPLDWMEIRRPRPAAGPTPQPAFQQSSTH